MFLERHRSWKEYSKSEQKERGDPKTASDSTERSVYYAPGEPNTARGSE